MAVESNRISHAYLFSGPRGCGKTSTARILARVINCENVKNGNPCNKCNSCLAVLKGTHLDVMEIDGASHTGVESVREMCSCPTTSSNVSGLHFLARTS
jgi:DNA polymerase-3 subunit gamma/tau